MNKKIQEWVNLIVKGLNNGLTHTINDGRINDIDWVRRRLDLWESFGRCLIALEREQNYEHDERELVKIAELGYKKEEAKLNE